MMKPIDSKTMYLRLSLYFRLVLSLAGVILFVALVLFFVGVKGYRGLDIWLFCALPLIANLVIGLPAWMVYFWRRRKKHL